MLLAASTEMFIELVAKNATIVWLRLCSKLFYLSILPGGILRRAPVTWSVRFSTFNSSVAMVPGKYRGRDKKNKT